MNVESMLDDILRREAGFVDHDADRGGPTNKGITLATLEAWRGRETSIIDLQALTAGEAREIYRERYLRAPGLDRIRDPDVLALAFDCAVNHGAPRVVRWIQKIVGVIDDGVMGPRTAAAIDNCDPRTLYRRLIARRIEFYGEIINRNHAQAVFALGWLRRAAEFVERTP